MKNIYHIQFHFKELFIYNEIEYYQIFHMHFLNESIAGPFILHLYTKLFLHKNAKKQQMGYNFKKVFFTI